MTMKNTSPMRSAVSTVTMLGWLSVASRRGSLQQLAEIERLAVGHLERDLLVDPGVFGQEHRAEPAAAERREDLVLADHLVAEEHRPAV